MRCAQSKMLIISVIMIALITASLDCSVFAQVNVQVVRINAQRFFFRPNNVTLKVGVPTVLELVSKDATHGFYCPGLGIRSDIPPHTVTTVRFTPRKTGIFPFRCDVPCGSGHDRMTGTITVVQ
jgi:cytochrome c oxidase subunit II